MLEVCALCRETLRVPCVPWECGHTARLWVLVGDLNLPMQAFTSPS